MTNLLLYTIMAYLIGSFPTGTIVAHFKGVSLFNPGERTTMRAGEVFKVLGNKAAMLVTLVDALKGTFVVSLLLTWLIKDPNPAWWVISIGGLLAVVGHCNSAYLGLRGGRGLATSFGVLFYLMPIPTLLSWVVWGCLSFWGLSTKPGALSSAGAMPIFSIAWVLYKPEHTYFLYLVAFLSLWIIWEHRDSLIAYFGQAKMASAPVPKPTIQTPQEEVPPIHSAQVSTREAPP